MLTHKGTVKLETMRLTLRRFVYEDTADMLKYWVSDPDIQFMYSEPIYTTDGEVRELLDKYISSYEKEDYYRWAIIERKKGVCIGQVAFFLVDNKNRFCELEYCIGKEFQRQGYCSESVEEVVKFAFKEVDFHKVQVCHKENNAASMGVILHCGFKYEGTLRDYFYIEDENGSKYVSRLYYSMLQEEWYELKRQQLRYLKMLDSNDLMTECIRNNLQKPETDVAFEIITKRLRLREWTEDDYSALNAIMQDDEVMYAYNGAFTDAETYNWLHNQFTNYKLFGFGLWAVELRETGEIIGQCGLTFQEFEDDLILEVGYLFNKAYWHKGYATEAAIACKEYAFNFLNAKEVFSIIRDTNIPSQKVAERNGMVKVGEYTKHFKGVDMNHYVYGVKK